MKRVQLMLASYLQVEVVYIFTYCSLHFREWIGLQQQYKVPIESLIMYFDTKNVPRCSMIPKNQVRILTTSLLPNSNASLIF